MNNRFLNAVLTTKNQDKSYDLAGSIKKRQAMLGAPLNREARRIILKQQANNKKESA